VKERVSAMPANSNVILSHAEINDFNVSRSVIQGRPIFLLGDPGTQLERGMEGRELMFASVSTSDSHRCRMRYIGVFMMAIQDFRRAAGTLNRSRTTRTYIYIDSGGAWIEKTGIRGRGCAYSYSCVLRFNFAFAPYPEWL